MAFEYVEGEETAIEKAARKREERRRQKKLEAKQTYQSITVTDTERGRKVVYRRHSGRRRSSPVVKQTTTTTQRYIEGQQPKKQDIAPDPQRNVSKQIVMEKEKSITTQKEKSITTQKDKNYFGANIITKATPPSRFELFLRQSQQDSRKKQEIVGQAKAVAAGSIDFVGAFGKTVFLDIPRLVYQAAKKQTIRRNDPEYITERALRTKDIYDYFSDQSIRRLTNQKIVSDVNIQIEDRPGTVFGTVAGMLFDATAISKTSNIFKNVAVKGKSYLTGGKEVLIDDVLSKDVLSGKSQFPLSKGTKDSLARFNVADETGKIKVVSTSPEKISGNIATAGRKGAVGLEDPGIFVTPKGEGSPAFLRIAGEADEVKVTLNPFEDILNQPQLTEFQVKSVDMIPSKVTKQPGFSAVDDFFTTTGSKTGKAYITKRSQIGQGDIASQTFRASDDFIIDMGGKNLRYNKGQLIREAGTSEIEAVIPKDSMFLDEGGAVDFFRFEGRNVPIRRVKVVGASDDIIRGTQQFKRVSSANIIKSTKDLSSVAQRTTRVSPTSAIGSSIMNISQLFKIGGSSKPVSKTPLSRPFSRPSSVSSFVSNLKSSMNSFSKSSFSRPFSSTSRGSSGRSFNSFIPSSSSTSTRNSSAIGSSTSKIIPPKTPGFPIKLPEEPRYRKTKSRKKKKYNVASRYGYSASLYAQEFDIKINKGSKLARISKITGIGIRPIQV